MAELERLTITMPGELSKVLSSCACSKKDSWIFGNLAQVSRRNPPH